jgi:2-dehydropantoate 2-reductase
LPTIEADFLNGEIVLLGRQRGIPTPYNHVLQNVANQMASSGQQPGSFSIEQLQRMVDEGAEIRA